MPPPRRVAIVAGSISLLCACVPPEDVPLLVEPFVRGVPSSDIPELASLAKRPVGRPLSDRIEEARVEPAHDRGHFIDISPSDVERPTCPRSDASLFEAVGACVGLEAAHDLGEHAYFYLMTGQAVADFDGDGWLDIYVTNSAGPNLLFHNTGSGSFVLSDESESVALEDAESGGAVFVDYDNDGDMDLYVLNFGPNVLFRNEGGWFVDVTERSGLGDPRVGTTASFADYDSDGWLDLYVSNYFCDEVTCGDLGVASLTSDALYRNRGDGTFEDVTSILPRGLTRGAGFVASWGDFDDDEDLDLYVVNDWGEEDWNDPQPDLTNRNLLWRNDGPGCAPGWCFREIGVTAGVDARIDGMGLAVGDYDSDGRLDLFMSDKQYPVLYRNLGEGKFEDVSERAGVARNSFGWGAVFADVDNDADLDIFLGTSRVEGQAFSTQGLLFLNGGDGAFESVDGFSPIEQEMPTYGVAQADFDRDGAVDLLLGHRGFRYELYQNVSRQPDANWVTIRLEGRGPVNRNAIGARVKLQLSDGRVLTQEIKCGSSLGSGSDLALHFGLGANQIEAVQVRWPNGRVDSPEPPPTNRELLYVYVP